MAGAACLALCPCPIFDFWPEMTYLKKDVVVGGFCRLFLHSALWLIPTGQRKNKFK